MNNAVRSSSSVASRNALTWYAVRGANRTRRADSGGRRMASLLFSTTAETKPLKRALDIAGAVAGIVLFGPLMLVIAALVAANGGKVLFAHKRIGRGGRTFRCLKFRTMVPDAQTRLSALLASDPEARAEWERDHKLRRDPRTTAFGAFLRTTRLDELPQFFNVLKGDMSLVGPRPIATDEIKKYGDKFALYTKCRPGITGAWRVSGRNDVSYETRVALDAHYSLNQSLRYDFIILMQTFGVVLAKTGAR